MLAAALWFAPGVAIADATAIVTVVMTRAVVCGLWGELGGTAALSMIAARGPQARRHAAPAACRLNALS